MESALLLLSAAGPFHLVLRRVFGALTASLGGASLNHLSHLELV